MIELSVFSIVLGIRILSIGVGCDDNKGLAGTDAGRRLGISAWTSEFVTRIAAASAVRR